jgi:hypothetical protein
VKGFLVTIGPGPDVALFEDVNVFARDTPWLHAAVLTYAGYGLAWPGSRCCCSQAGGTLEAGTPGR